VGGLLDLASGFPHHPSVFNCSVLQVKCRLPSGDPLTLTRAASPKNSATQDAFPASYLRQ
jgi:hypothetical protein